MKKIICISLIMILTLAVFAGCSGKNSNPTPLTPVYANGVSPDYSAVGTQGNDDVTEPSDTSAPGESQTTDTIPVGYSLYSDDYVSFVHPIEFKETLRMYLHDTKNDSSIIIYEQAVDSTNTLFAVKAYAEVTESNLTETYAQVVGTGESIADAKVTKSTKDGYEITVIQYYEKVEEDTSEETTAEGTQTAAAPAGPRLGTADIHIEKSADTSFNEILVRVTANEYPAESIPEDHTNFTELVSKIVASIKVGK